MKNLHVSRWGRLIVAFALVATSVSASDLPVNQAVVFKNGIGFLTRTPEVEFKNGHASLDGIPSASYGGLWIAAERRGVTIDAAFARMREISSSGSAGSIADLLDANNGRQVTVEVGDAKLSGILRSSRDESFVTIESGGRSTAIVKGSVRSVTVSGGLSKETSTTASRVVLDLEAQNASGTIPIAISSLERGIGWTPEYEVRIGDDGRADISLRAVLVNDVASLENATVSFAVGFPRFQFAEVRTPLDPGQSLDQFIGSLTRSGWRRPVGPMANVMTQAVVMSGPASEGGTELPAEFTQGEQHQDLYLYSKTGVSLAKGERVSMSLMAMRAPFNHTWDWEIADTSRVSVYGYQENRETDDLRDQVWHSIRLENGSSVPWTTGPALILDGTTPVAQNTLHYTPTGGSTRLRLTVATDIAADHSEIEKARATETMRKFGNTYEGIDYEGTLNITNHRKETVTVDASRTLTGSVSAAGEGGESVRLAEEPSVINPRSKIDWSVAVEPGKTKTVVYRYRVWVRR